MECIIGPMGLELPIQNRSDSDIVDMKPKHIKKYLSDLNLIDLSSSTKKVYLALHDAHQVKMPIADRYEIMEHFHNAVCLFEQTVHERYLNNRNYLFEKKQKIMMLVQALYLKMTRGYKIVLENLAANLKK